MSGRGALVVVGMGIRAGLQTTSEARRCIQRADKVLYLASDFSAPQDWIHHLNPSARSLARFYAPGKPRTDTYAEIVEEVLGWIREGNDVCLALYGHPGVFADPAHHAIRQATQEGFPARMLPAVSAEDCLFADLGVDPGDGCQSFEATDFLLYPPRFDISTSLILWQIAAVGRREAVATPDLEGLAVLAEQLSASYGPHHEVVLYEATTYAIGEPSIQRVPLRHLPSAHLTGMTTLYVPPLGTRTPDPAMFVRLGVDPGHARDEP
jgi:uncharacterized protein YabN with tetrapyrrole methylase and pyrophosphatase domain